MDNGAYYYYNPLPNKTYEETILEINDRLMIQDVPIKYVNYDSWFYEKGRSLLLKHTFDMEKVRITFLSNVN